MYAETQLRQIHALSEKVDRVSAARERKSKIQGRIPVSGSADQFRTATDPASTRYIIEKGEALS